MVLIDETIILPPLPWRGPPPPARRRVIRTFPNWIPLVQLEADVQREGLELILESLIKCCLVCTESNEKLCIICQDDIRLDEEVTVLRCGHVYHLDCIKRWLMVKNECGVCRAPAISVKKWQG